MNPLIAKQLKLLKVADIPVFDENTTSIIIPKKVPNQVLIQEDHYYLIELESYLINPSENFTLHTQWNNDVVPTEKFMKCHVVKIMGKMLKIEGVGFDYENKIDLDVIWDGWLPLKSIKVLREI